MAGPCSAVRIMRWRPILVVIGYHSQLLGTDEKSEESRLRLAVISGCDASASFPLPSEMVGGMLTPDAYATFMAQGTRGKSDALLV